MICFSSSSPAVEGLHLIMVILPSQIDEKNNLGNLIESLSESVSVIVMRRYREREVKVTKLYY